MLSLRREITLRKAKLNLLILFFLPALLHSADIVVGHLQVDILRLQNPEEEIESARIKMYANGNAMIIHSKGVMSAKSERFSGDMLKKLGYAPYHEGRTTNIKTTSKEEVPEKSIKAPDSIPQESQIDYKALFEVYQTLVKTDSIKFNSINDLKLYLRLGFLYGEGDYFSRESIERLLGTTGNNMTIMSGSIVDLERWDYIDIIKDPETREYTIDLYISFEGDDIRYRCSGEHWTLGKGEISLRKEVERWKLGQE